MPGKRRGLRNLRAGAVVLAGLTVFRETVSEGRPEDAWMFEHRPHHITEGPTVRKRGVALFDIFPLAFYGSTQCSGNGNVNSQLAGDIALKGSEIQSRSGVGTDVVPEKELLTNRRRTKSVQFQTPAVSHQLSQPLGSWRGLHNELSPRSQQRPTKHLLQGPWQRGV